MLLFDQIIGGILWFGLVLAVGGIDAALANAERLGVWYRAGGSVSKKDKEVADATWFGRLKKRLMLPTGWAIFVGIVAYACLAFSAWYPWTFFDETRTAAVGIAIVALILFDVLLVLLFSPIFYWGKSVLGAVITLVLQVLATAGAIVCVGLALWHASFLFITDVAAFVTLCVYEAYVIYELIYYGMIYADMDETAADYDSVSM
jgi:tryptophan-rich sensory protein